VGPARGLPSWQLFAIAVAIWSTTWHAILYQLAHNTPEVGVALRFAALYALVLLASAWLSDVAGSHGLYAAALASGLVDVDPIVLSALNLFSDARLSVHHAVAAIALAYVANVVFKLAVLLWYDRRLALRVLWPLIATVAGGAAAYFGLAR